MRKSFAFFLFSVSLSCILPGMIFAANSGDPVKKYGMPFLITNAGQGPGGKMARLLVSQTKTIALETDYWYKSEPVEADLQERPYKALMVVIGSSDKGLGASGITIDQEIARLEKVVKFAKERKLPIIAVLLEKDKRSAIASNPNERCIDTICPHAEWMIVVKAGNSDKRFDKLKAKYNIPLTFIDNAIDFTQLCKQSFIK